ncbi:MAG: hypothetical protein ACTSSA_08365 [Candidatus Freyarchaeota archaeon]
MSYYRPTGVTLIAFFLLLYATGSVIAALHYLSIVLSPPLLQGSLPGVSYTYYPYWSPGAPLGFFQYTLLYNLLVFQSMFPLLSSQVIFYLILGVLFVLAALGLWRMKNWARLVTISYAILSVTFSFIPFLPATGYYGYSFFNINIIFVLFTLLPSQYVFLPYYLVMLIPLILGIVILMYLNGDVKYEFE